MRARLTLLIAVATVLSSSLTARATFPGANGLIAFMHRGHIFTMNPDGTRDTVDVTEQDRPRAVVLT